MRRFLIWFFSLFGILIICILGLYAGLTYYYWGRFPYGIRINDVYCTGMTPEEAAGYMNSMSVLDSICIDIGDEYVDLDFEDIDFRYDYASALREYLQNGSQYLWYKNLLFSNSNVIILPKGGFDKDKLERKIEALDSSLWECNDCQIILTESGYVFKDGKGTCFDMAKTTAFIEEELAEGSVNFVVDDSCRKVESESPKEAELKSLYEEIEAYQNKEITYRFDDGDMPLSTLDLCHCLVKDKDNLPVRDEEGKFELDDVAVREMLHNRFERYNTYKNHYFLTHDKRQIYIDTGTFGNLIDEEKECERLKGILKSDRRKASLEPEYLKQSGRKACDDIGSTYIEVSIEEQHLYYYVDGNLTLDTDVVTGGVRAGNDTPTGVVAVYGKQKNRTLVGETYRSFVKYWIPVYKNIGIHDASWRSSYGGNIYISSGSHGCINTPLEEVSRLYDMVDIGTPVIIY
ncbi:MAG: L,D-transpeptidase family protein [Lachnospiraceae bacterium]|nr:L,D-transpeptidase family protein [Lachnospiraceae bacterium]